MTLTTLGRLWSLDRLPTQDFCEKLARSSLVQDYDEQTLTVHDVTLKYLRQTLPNAADVHARLLDAWGNPYTLPDDYAWRYYTYHLRGAGRHAELYDLLTASPAWMEAKFAACGGDTSYAADLDQAIADFADPLTADQALILAQLHAARQVVHARVSAYTDDDLKILVWLGREQEALSHARLRSEPTGQFAGLMAVYEAQQRQNRADHALLEELLPLARGIPDAEDRASALRALAAALAQAGHYTEAGEVAPAFRRNGGGRLP